MANIRTELADIFTLSTGPPDGTFADERCAQTHRSARLVGPGDGVLLEDVTGAGHTTRVGGDEPASGMFVQVSE